MKHFLLIIFSIPFFCLAQKNLPCGQGVLKVEVSKLPTLLFYEDSTQTKPKKSVTIIEQQDWKIKNEKEVLTWLQPEKNFVAEDILIFRVDTFIGAWAKVYINNQKATTLWIKTDANKKFFSWNKFFKKQVTNITKGSYEVEIKKEKNESSKIIKMMEAVDCFEIIEVNGDWLKIKTHTLLDCSSSKKPIKMGWIKWKYLGKMVVDFGLSC